MSKFVSDLKGDCPRRDVHSLHERCDVLCPDLPKALDGAQADRDQQIPRRCRRASASTMI
jgi:hypothetical protein